MKWKSLMHAERALCRLQLMYHHNYSRKLPTRNAAGEMLPPAKDCVQWCVGILARLLRIERVAHPVSQEVERK